MTAGENVKKTAMNKEAVARKMFNLQSTLVEKWLQFIPCSHSPAGDYAACNTHFSSLVFHVSLFPKVFESK